MKVMTFEDMLWAMIGGASDHGKVRKSKALYKVLTEKGYWHAFDCMSDHARENHGVTLRCVDGRIIARPIPVDLSSFGIPEPDFRDKSHVAERTVVDGMYRSTSSLKRERERATGVTANRPNPIISEAELKSLLERVK